MTVELCIVHYSIHLVCVAPPSYFETTNPEAGAAARQKYFTNTAGIRSTNMNVVECTCKKMYMSQSTLFFESSRSQITDHSSQITDNRQHRQQKLFSLLLPQII